MQVMCVNSGVGEDITCFVTVKSYYSVSFLSLTTSSSSTSNSSFPSNNFYVYVCLYILLMFITVIT